MATVLFGYIIYDIFNYSLYYLFEGLF